MNNNITIPEEIKMTDLIDNKKAFIHAYPCGGEIHLEGERFVSLRLGDLAIRLNVDQSLSLLRQLQDISIVRF